jgi:hypothetical protein
MKTYRQKLAKWVDNKISSVENDEVINILEEVKLKIKEMEKEEEHMVNSTYDRGFNDCKSNKGRSSNHYKQTYKTHDTLKSMIK